MVPTPLFKAMNVDIMISMKTMKEKRAPYLKESLFPYKIAILNAIKAFILVLIYFWYYYLITMKKKNQQAMLLEYASTASHRKKHFWTLWNQTEDNIHKIQGKLN